MCVWFDCHALCCVAAVLLSVCDLLHDVMIGAWMCGHARIVLLCVCVLCVLRVFAVRGVC